MLKESSLIALEEKALKAGVELVEVMNQLELESYTENLMTWISEREKKSFNNLQMDNHNLKMINHYQKELKYIRKYFKKDHLEAFLERHIEDNEGDIRGSEKEYIIESIESHVGSIKNLDLELNEYDELNGLVRGKKGIFNVSITNTAEDEFFKFVTVITKL